MSPELINFIASWAPPVLLFAALVLFVRRGGMRARAPSGHSMIELYELQLEEMKRSTAAMERIAQVLEARPRS